MTNALSTHAGLGNLYATSIADNAFVANFFIFSAVTFPVLRRSEDPLAEQTIALRLQGTIVDGLRLLNLSVGPLQDLLRGSQTDLDSVKCQRLISCFICLRHERYSLLLF